MSKKHQEAETLWQMDRDHVVHPYTNFSSQAEDGSQVIVNAEGAYIQDTEGRKLLDGIGGLWCVNIGHFLSTMADVDTPQAPDTVE